MKASLFVMITLIVALACNTAQKPNPDEQDISNDVEVVVPTSGLALDSAQDFAWRYDRKLFELFRNENPIRGFRIPTADLLEAIGASPKTKTKFQFVRIYIGIDTLQRFRAFLTPVVDVGPKYPAGRDSILFGKYRDGWGPSDDVKEGLYVMDFTMPCPNSCDPDSKIFKKPEINIK